MPALIDIRRRIRSVKNTRQITRAMKMVSAARLRRSQDAIIAARPYAQELRKVMANVARRAEEGDSPLLARREEKRVLLMVVAGDKGLCGAFNTGIFRHVQRRCFGRWEELELLLVGKKPRDFFRRRTRHPIRESYPGIFANVTYDKAREVAGEVIDGYITEDYDAVYVVYNRFESVLRQKLTEERLLPIRVPEDVEDEPAGGYLYEPTPTAILADLLPRYVTFETYRILLESQAAEHAARMTAMDSATKNASDMIDRLTLKYNRARQAAITTEIIEVVSGANALEAS